MKKVRYLIFILIPMLLIGIFSFNFNAKDYTEIYLHGRIRNIDNNIRDVNITFNNTDYNLYEINDLLDSYIHNTNKMIVYVGNNTINLHVPEDYSNTPNDKTFNGVVNYIMIESYDGDGLPIMVFFDYDDVQLYYIKIYDINTTDDHITIFNNITFTSLYYDFLRDSYDAGYNNGYRIGHYEGYSLGQDNGYDSGVSDMQELINQMEQTIQDAYQQGLDDGYAEGVQHVFDAEYEEVYDEIFGMGRKYGYAEALEKNSTKFMSGIEKWIVPAILLVILVGGFLAIRSNRNRGE